MCTEVDCLWRPTVCTWIVSCCSVHLWCHQSSDVLSASLPEVMLVRLGFFILQYGSHVGGLGISCSAKTTNHLSRRCFGEICCGHRLSCIHRQTHCSLFYKYVSAMVDRLHLQSTTASRSSLRNTFQTIWAAMVIPAALPFPCNADVSQLRQCSVPCHTTHRTVCLPQPDLRIDKSTLPLCHSASACITGIPNPTRARLIRSSPN